MPLATLAELFAAGAQHSVEGLLDVFPEAGVLEVRDVIRRRFGERLEVDLPTASNLLNRVIRGRTIADQINRGETDLSPLPPGPWPASGYQYTVLVSVPDPEDPEDIGRRVTVPLSVPSPSPLNREELRARVEAMLSAWDPPRDTIPGGPAADLIRRDIMVRSRMMDFEGDVGGVDIGVNTVYRGGQ